ncbi:hypothetical protein DMC30DRAFT_415794 [Rhodotorula diobovata]|uniref:Ubiquitin-like domain-containing protein n=1 Tax=Rhodotorula diobovata TaxID=5288 RepID=A0A5C5FY01_9BASI|nr:hypothetical protein DMC30DRAFT_415794 [Rhodotorula diobovata]
MGVKGEPGQEPEAKPDTATKINLTIRFGNELDDIAVKIKPTTRFERVYKAVAENQGRGADTFRLNWDGHRLLPHETPESLGFDEQEVVDCHLEQIGGGGGGAGFARR